MNGFMSFMEQKDYANNAKDCRTTTFISNSKRGYFYITVNDRRIIFLLSFLNLPIDAYMEWIAPFRYILDIPFRFTVGLMALYAAFGVGASLANFYQLNQLSAGLLSVLAFFTSIS